MVYNKEAFIGVDVAKARNAIAIAEVRETARCVVARQWRHHVDDDMRPRWPSNRASFQRRPVIVGCRQLKPWEA
jgi:hypothetical protein